MDIYDEKIAQDYLAWLISIVDTPSRQTDRMGRLFRHLLQVPFVYTIPMDENRAGDGMTLRYSYFNKLGIGTPAGEASVLEVLIYLAIRIEQTMVDPDIGDRVSEWFWVMMDNLGLSSIFDEVFDEVEVNNILINWFNRNYEPDGKGGLFWLPGVDVDMRMVDIWFQANRFMDSIT